MMFRVILCIQFYRLTQLIFSTLLKGIIRKECQSFTNHGHDKTPPTVFNPLSLWLTLPRNMGVSHTVWPPSITRAILACLWFAQYDVQGDSMYSILSIDATYFFNITIDKLTIYMLWSLYSGDYVGLPLGGDLFVNDIISLAVTLCVIGSTFYVMG